MFHTAERAGYGRFSDEGYGGCGKGVSSLYVLFAQGERPGAYGEGERMGWFKRLCLFVFGLAGILALVALCLPWVGPYTSEAAALIHVNEYFYVLEALVAITGLGCLICLLRSLFTPRNRKEIIISQDNGDQITVTRAAIASQAEHIVERDGTCTAGTVRVNARKRGNIKVFVRVTPKRSLNVVEKGKELHAELDEGLAQIAADKIRSVNLEFTDPEEMDVDVSVPSASSYDHSAYDDDDLSMSPDVAPAAADEPAALEPVGADSSSDSTDLAPVGGQGSGITVSMSSFHHGGTESADDGSAQEARDDGHAVPTEGHDPSLDDTTSLEVTPSEPASDAAAAEAVTSSAGGDADDESGEE